MRDIRSKAGKTFFSVSNSAPGIQETKLTFDSHKSITYSLNRKEFRVSVGPSLQDNENASFYLEKMTQNSSPAGSPSKIKVDFRAELEPQVVNAKELDFSNEKLLEICAYPIRNQLSTRVPLTFEFKLSSS